MESSAPTSTNAPPVHAGIVDAQGGAIDTDALIIGAGPVGLFQVFQLGLHEVHAHVVDALPHVGGQTVELYPDKLIFDIPALPPCTGQELADKLFKQCAPFAPQFHLGQEVTGLSQRPDGRFDVVTSRGTRFISSTVFIAAGVGAFQPRKLNIEGLAAFEGQQVHYHPRSPVETCDQHVLVVGGDDAALRCAVNLAESSQRSPASVTLLHRRDSFTAEPGLVDTFQALCLAGKLTFQVGQVTGCHAAEGHLDHVQITGVDGLTHDRRLDQLLVFLGISPRLGPIAHWGLAMERKQLEVNTETFSTSVPGIFAVGDINTYPGKKKLIVCGFHECVLAAFGAVSLIRPQQPVLLQYTTTSPRLHKLLGV